MADKELDRIRKGKIGDWKEHFTAEMVEMVDRIMQQKLNKSGLSFN